MGERDEDNLIADSKKVEDIDEKLGFGITELTSDLKRQLRLTNDVNGVVVNRIEESSNAYERGLRKNDVITAVKRSTVETIDEFYKEVQKSVDNGDKAILLTIERNNMKQFIAFRL